MEAKINNTAFRYPEKVGLVRRVKTELEITMPKKLAVAAVASSGSGGKSSDKRKDAKKTNLDKERSPVAAKKKIRAKTATIDKRISSLSADKNKSSGKNNSGSDNESRSSTSDKPPLVRRKTKSDLHSNGDRPKTSTDRKSSISKSDLDRGKTLIDELLDKGGRTRDDPTERKVESQQKKKSDLDSTTESIQNGDEDGGLVLTKTDLVFRGCLDDLPPLGSRIVRIFTSSTFTDTTLERNALMGNVYPILKKYCREQHGLEFQVVDMRWGVRDEATDDHMTTELCMKEIENCQRLSTGPNFVVFLGQKYGYRPMPTKIPAKLFDAICGVTKDSKGDLELLRQWYQLDINSIPAVYILQPISSILTNYNNKRHKTKMEQDRNLWWEIFGKITRILRKCAYVLQLTRKITREEMHDFFMSVTEREIVHGILNAKDVGDHCLAYIRIIENMNMSAFLHSCKFIDFSGRKADDEAAKLLAKLRDQRLPNKLPESNLARFTVEWSREGVDNVTHAEYLNNFCDHFKIHVTGLIDRAVAKNEALGTDSIYIEILQHLHACQNFCKIFQGREEVVGKIQDYVCGDSQLPLVLHGESGCGKTSLLAKGASEVIKWKVSNAIEPILVLRFLGTSPNSSTIMPLLQSLCTQIATVYGEPLDEIPSELAPLSQYFKRLVSCATFEKPLLLFLDSLDQLSGADGAHSLAWLPIELPPNMKVVVSTLPNYYGLLDTLHRAIPQEESFVQVTPLGANLSSMILKSWLKNANRQITTSQWDIVVQAISKCNLPLFVKLVFDEICRWKSYSSPTTCELSFTIHDNIVQLFERIEKQHGRTLVSRALGYITASKSGISEAELEDLLSLDEKVLNDVYQWHLPPVRRIPPLLWTRIRNDLPAYLSEREADGINVIDWYHRQFIVASRERYFRNVNLLSEIHSNLAEYYRGTWAGRPKPFEFSDLQRQRFNTEERGGMSDRKVSAQPLAFTDPDGNIIRYNLRKLNELPHHFVRSHRYEELLHEVLFNYKWLHAKLSCMPLQNVLGDFDDALQVMPGDKDIALVADALRLSSSVLTRYPDMLAPQILGRLLPYYSRSKKINSLLKQCDSDGLNDCALVPAHHYLHTPGGPLQFSLEGHPFAPFGIAVTSDQKYLVSASNQFIIWDLTTGEIFRVINPSIKGIMSNLLLFSNDLNAVSFTNNDQVIVCNIITGEFSLIDRPLEGADSIIGVCVSDDLYLAVWSSQEIAVYDCSGEFVARLKNSKPTCPIIHVQIVGDQVYCLNKTGAANDDDMTLSTMPYLTTDGSINPITNCEIQKTNTNAGSSISNVPNGHPVQISAPSITNPFEFHSAIAISRDGMKVYACIAISDNAVAAYRRNGNMWKYERTLPDNCDNVYCLTLSADGKFVAATGMVEYKVWEMIDLFHCTMIAMKLPSGIRNIPNKNPMSSLVAFSENNQYFIAGVRKVLYVWQTKTGELLRSLDAHFGRIIALTAAPVGSITVVSSSIDKTIKVWNFDNIRESVNHIDRHEKPIEGVSLARSQYIGAAVARNCVGLWNLESGQMTSSLVHSGSSAIVTHAQITDDARYVISAESGNILIWDVESKKAIKSSPEPHVLHLLITADDRKFLTISKSPAGGGTMTCRGIPSGSTTFTLKYNYGERFLEPVLTSDGLFIVAPSVDKKGVEVLSVYHAKTGTHLYDTQPKYSNYTDYHRLLAMPADPTQIALIDGEKGNIWDIKKKTFVRSVQKWNGQCTQDGKYGLYAPTRGGLQLLDLKTGHVVHQLIPKVAEGVFSVKTTFTKNNQHILYYHSGHRTIRVFRVTDGKRIANYRSHADVTSMIGTPDGAAVVLGCTDGSVTMLNIADPQYERGREVLRIAREKLESPPNSPIKSAYDTQRGMTSSVSAKTVDVAVPSQSVSSQPQVKVDETSVKTTELVNTRLPVGNLDPKPGDQKLSKTLSQNTNNQNGTKDEKISPAIIPVKEPKLTDSSSIDKLTDGKISEILPATVSKKSEKDTETATPVDSKTVSVATVSNKSEKVLLTKTTASTKLEKDPENATPAVFKNVPVETVSKISEKDTEIAASTFLEKSEKVLGKVMTDPTKSDKDLENATPVVSMKSEVSRTDTSISTQLQNVTETVVTVSTKTGKLPEPTSTVSMNTQNVLESDGTVPEKSENVPETENEEVDTSIDSPKPTVSITTASKTWSPHSSVVAPAMASSSSTSDKISDIDGHKSLDTASSVAKNSKTKQTSSNAADSSTSTVPKAVSSVIRVNSKDKRNSDDDSSSKENNQNKIDDDIEDPSDSRQVRKLSRNMTTKLVDENYGFKSRSAEDLVHTETEPTTQPGSDPTSPRRTSLNAAMMIARQVGKRNHRRKQNPQSRACVIS